ncbi:MAG TPA: PadR family transcriptional regulator [Steroidobacteraceae bacterium]|nr:PadR family transcriptional regulator [Steroidobacteraceae bacterium]
MYRPFPRFFGKAHGGRGFHRFGGWFMGGGELGGRGFAMGRKLSSADLQLLILRLLADKPHHGYEIIKALEERSNGFYAPSPGMVYPALTYLEEIGHATVETDGPRKRYHITDSGREYLAEHRAATDALLAQFSRVAERMAHLRRAMRSEEARENAADEEHQGSKALRRARRALKSALADKWDSSSEEQERVAEILKRAALEIGGKGPRE